MEEACTRLPQGGRGAQGRFHSLTQEKLSPPKLNITLEEQKSIRALKEDQSWVVLTADKGGGHGCHGQGRLHRQGLSMIGSHQHLQPYHRGPTNKLSKTHKDIKNQGGLNDHIYR